MPHRQLPNSVPTVLRCLITARDQYKNTPNAADRAISAELFAQLDDSVPDSLLNRFIKEVGNVNLDLAAQGTAVDATEKAAVKLTMLVSHFHQGLDRGIARGTFAPGAREYYGRPIHAASIPDLTTHDTVMEAADKIVKGEAARAAAEGQGQPLTMDSGLRMNSGLKMDTLVGGYVAMALPSAAEVGEALTEFRALISQSGQAMDATGKQRKTSKSLYPQAQALAVDICDTVEFFYRKDPIDANRRADCRRWGVTYVSNPAAPAPPTPPAPSVAAK